MSCGRKHRKHGTRGTFMSSCRCESCRTADREYKAAWGLAKRRAAGIPPRHVPQHGEYVMYGNGCRCEDCRAAHRAACARFKAQRIVARQPAIHGRYTTYENWDCRCVPCSDAMRIKNAERYKSRKGRVSA